DAHARPVEHALELDPGARLAVEHTVEAEPADGDPQRERAVARAQLGQAGVELRRRRPAGELAVDQQPAEDEREILVEGRAFLRPDTAIVEQFLRRRAELVVEAVKRPALHVPPDALGLGRVPAQLALAHEAAALVLEPAPARTGIVASDLHAHRLRARPDRTARSAPSSVAPSWTVTAAITEAAASRRQRRFRRGSGPRHDHC